MDANCKGSWMLGTACGKCESCKAEAVRLLPNLIARDKEHSAFLEKMIQRVPRFTSSGVDISDNFKARCFDEARTILYDHAK